MKNKKIAIIGPNFNFINEVTKELSKENEIISYYKDTRQITQEMKNEIQNIMEKVDIAFFEWCSEFLMCGSELPKTCKIACRLHSNEAFVGKATYVDWNNVDLLIFTNESVHNLTKQQILLPKNTQIIRHGTDISKFTFFPNGRRTKKIGYSGNVNWKKNTPLLLYCFKKIHDYDSEYTLHVAGQQEDLRMNIYFNYFVCENNLPVVMSKKRIEKNEMPEWYQDKDFLLNTSLFEGCFYSGTEAMACGVTPLIHNWYGAKNLYPTKYIFNTPDDCLEILKKTEEKDFQILKKENRQFVLDNHNEDTASKRIYNALSKLL